MDGAAVALEWVGGENAGLLRPRGLRRRHDERALDVAGGTIELAVRAECRAERNAGEAGAWLCNPTRWDSAARRGVSCIYCGCTQYKYM